MSSTMMSKRVLNCPVSSGIDLNEVWSRDDVTTHRIIQLLIEHDREFKACRRGNKIAKISGQLLSEGRAFMSKVYRVQVDFEPNTPKSYSFVLKVSQHMLWKDYADGNKSDSPTPLDLDENQNCCLREKQKDMMEIGVRYHNTECQFYESFPQMAGCPTPRTSYVERIDNAHNGLILMENLADISQPLGFYSSATREQVLSVAKAAANLHFSTDRPDLRPRWERLVGYVFLDLFVDEFQITGFPLLKVYPELVELLDAVKVVFSRQFCYYSLLDRPREYNALVCCHGDFQPNNILFYKDTASDGVTGEIAAILDWQLIFCGNPFTDLVRFLVGAADDELRDRVDLEAFNVYYDELERLYRSVGKHPNFTREQAYELYMLSLVEQTGSYIILMPFVEQRKSALNLDEQASGLFVKRITDAVRRIIPIIENYGLNKFSCDVSDWRQLMG